MNPILAAAAFGFVKGIVLDHLYGPAPKHLEGSFAEGVVLGPISEEIQFRLLPFLAMKAAGKSLPLGGTALPFGLLHADPKAPAGWNAFRITDAAIGGLIYEHSFRRYGLAGAILAHGLHNLLVSWPRSSSGLGKARLPRASRGEARLGMGSSSGHRR